MPGRWIDDFLEACRKRPAAAGLLCLLGAAALVSLKVGIANGLAGGTDFQWSTSRQLLAHEDPYAFFLAYARGDSHDAPFLSQRPNYPPSALLLLFPFAALPWPVARALWLALNVLAVPGIAALLAQLYFAPTSRPLAFALLAAAMAMSTPFRVALQVGQHCLVALFFFCAALAAERQRRSGLAALCLAVSWLKYSVTGPLALFFLARPRRRVLVIALAVHAALTLLAAGWAGRNPLLFAYEPFLVNQQALWIGYVNVSQVLVPLGDAGFALAVALSALVLLIAVRLVLARARGDDLQLLCLLALVSAVVVFHEIYDMIVFVFLVAFLLRSWLAMPAPYRHPPSWLLALFFATVSAIWLAQRLVEQLARWVPAATPALPVFAALIVAMTYCALAASAAVAARSPQEPGEAEVR